MIKMESEMDAINAFLDAETYEDKINLMGQIHEFLSDHLINTLAASMDLVIEDGDLEDRFIELKDCIRTHQRFEVKRR